MRRLLVILLFVLGSATHAQIDTELLFKYDRIIYNESNDCTVRAYAVLTGMRYIDARKVMNDTLGRKTGNGLSGIYFAKYIINTERDRLVTARNYISERGRSAPQRAWIDTRVKDGHIYVVFTYEHVFVVKKYNNKWMSFGNKGDNRRDVIAYIELKE